MAHSGQNIAGLSTGWKVDPIGPVNLAPVALKILRRNSEAVRRPVQCIEDMIRPTSRCRPVVEVTKIGHRVNNAESVPHHPGCTVANKDSCERGDDLPTSRHARA